MIDPIAPRFDSVIHASTQALFRRGAPARAVILERAQRAREPEGGQHEAQPSASLEPEGDDPPKGRHLHHTAGAFSRLYPSVHLHQIE
jgi:hypothetical protein